MGEGGGKGEGEGVMMGRVGRGRGRERVVEEERDRGREGKKRSKGKIDRRDGKWDESGKDTSVSATVWTENPTVTLPFFIPPPPSHHTYPCTHNTTYLHARPTPRPRPLTCRAGGCREAVLPSPHRR